AMQVHSELSWLYAQAGARVVSCVGGMDARREARALADGCHIVVATPGRLRDHLERGQIDTHALRVVVLDEADEMLDLGFREDLEFILDATPPERRTLLFSATIAKDIVNLAREYQRDAVRINTMSQNEAHGDIEYRAIRVGARDVEHAIVNVLRFIEPRASIVFCHTRESVRRLHGSLLERGFDVVALSGELTQSERSHALQALRDGHARVCVATDVAARGLDLPDLGLVIHADIPTNRETLLHRSGRTGRAGRKGVCALIVTHAKRRRVEQLLNSANIKATWNDPPTADAIRSRDQERMLEDPILTEASSDEDLVLARGLLEGRSAEDVAAALIRLYRSRLPAPEDIFIEPFREERSDRRRDRPANDRYGDERHGSRDRAGAGRGEGRVPQEYRSTGENMVAFRVSAGRHQNADPKWLLPMICRRGQITKREIGAIRIFDRESIVEIAQDVAERFSETLRQTPESDIRIEPAGNDRPQGESPRREAPRREGTHRETPRRDGAHREKPRGEGPRRDAPSRDNASRDNATRSDRPARRPKPDDRATGAQKPGKKPYVKTDKPGEHRPDRKAQKASPEAIEASAKKLKKKLKKLQKQAKHK
ncbi:MAG: helicase-related protein, partial [Dongiaceae bacterium]